MHIPKASTADTNATPSMLPELTGIFFGKRIALKEEAML
jgi:hypothetical protein